MSKLTAARLKTAGRGVLYAVLAFALAALLVFASSQKVQTTFAQIPGWSLAVFSLGVVAGNILRLHRYVVFARRLHIRVPVGPMYLYATAGMALIATPGKIGTALRLWLLNTGYHIPYRQSAPMLVMDVLTDFLAMLALLLIAIGWMGNAAGLGLALTGFLVLLAGVLSIFAFPRLPRLAVKLLYALTGKRKKRAFATLLRLFSKLKSLFGVRTLLAAVALSFAGWAVLILGFHAMILALGLPLAWPMLLLVVCGGTMLGAISMLPGGLGGTEATMLALLAAAGLPLSISLMLVLILRTGTLWLPTLAGFAALPFALRHAKQARNR